MAETTQTGPAQATPTSWARCAWHGQMSPTARLVQIDDAGSGSNPPGLFACEPCREVYGLVPVADQP